MFTIIDYYLDRITMYRLVLYFLIALLIFALLFGFFGFLPYSPLQVLFSITVLLIICYGTNAVFSYIFEAPTNIESVYITALILALIVSPLTFSFDISFHSFANLAHGLVPIAWIGIWSMASKYIFAIEKKHIFNPVAIAAVITTYGIGFSPSWWVGNAVMMPLVLIGGLLIVRKIQRADLVFSFFIIAFVTLFVFSIPSGTNIVSLFSKVLLQSSLFFFAFVMLTEPLTTPPTKKLQILYGVIVGFLFAPQVHVGNIYSTPELTLVIGNIFSYIVSPKQKLLLLLKEKIQVAPDLFDFIFTPGQKLAFTPGQYMEWTLSHHHADSRGNRRYFSIASSPTENDLRIGVKFYPGGSSYKQELFQLTQNKVIVASQLAGDFVLPKNREEKCVFIAGGIGITPFRSMIKYILDKKEPRSLILLYAVKQPQGIMYKDVFDEAEKTLGIKTIYTITDEKAVPPDWTGGIGRITPELIQKEIPDFQERVFYLSGPHSMVNAYEETLRSLGVSSSRIKIDFFPGFA